jgi:hypothetical protein
MTLDEVRAAVRAIPPAQHFVWDGVDEDDRPATAEELQHVLFCVGILLLTGLTKRGGLSNIALR